MKNEPREPIAIFLPNLAGGGAERAMVKLANALARRGLDVDMVLARAVGPYLAELSTAVEVIDLARDRVVSSLPALIRYLRNTRPTVVLGALTYANIVALWASRLARSGTPVVVIGQNTLSVESAASPGIRNRLMPGLVRMFYPWAHRVVGNSEGVSSDLREVTNLPSSRVVTIANPIITPAIAEQAKEGVSHPWFRPGEPPVVLAIGRLSPQKDFETLIGAFAELRRRIDARLVILGEGPDHALLVRTAREAGVFDDVDFPGFVINPYAYLARSALFVLSSRWEGLPTVLVEALRCEVPVIATDCPSGPREILADGRFGCLVPVGDLHSLAEAMHDVLAADRLVAPAASWQRYDSDKIAKEYATMLGMSR